MRIDGNSQDSVKATQTSFRILEHLKELDGGRVTELAHAMGRAKSTIYRHLFTLEQLGYVAKEGEVYHVSLRFLAYSEHAKYRHMAFDLAKQKVDELARETDEKALFTVEENGMGIFVHRATGAHAVETDPGIGHRTPLHAVAGGKAILASFPNERVREIVERHGLPSFTENTITDPDRLFEELEETRQRGYGLNLEKYTEGVSAVGVSVTVPNRRTIGALSIVRPAHRMKGEWFEETLPDLLLGTANELELNITHS